MPATATHRAREFVQAARRSEPPRRTRSGSGTPASGSAALEAGKQKAAVVGLDNSTLLAQLVAKKKVLDPQRLFDGYDLYFDTLSRIGWAVQDKGFAVYVEQSQNSTRPRGHHEGGRHPAGAHSHQLGKRIWRSNVLFRGAGAAIGWSRPSVQALGGDVYPRPSTVGAGLPPQQGSGSTRMC